jgi:hypothetical protein
MEGSGHGLILRYYPSIHLKGLWKTTKNLSLDSWSLSQDLNPGSPKYSVEFQFRAGHMQSILSGNPATILTYNARKTRPLYVF